MNKKATSPIPILNWFEKPIKESIYSVFTELKNSTEALDIFKKYRSKHFKAIHKNISKIKILGMSQPVPLRDIYSPLYVSTTIYRRLYEKDWYNLGKHPFKFPALQSHRSAHIVRADEYIEKYDRVVVLGGPGSGKTTLLRYLALAYSDKKLFSSTRLIKSFFPIYITMLSYCHSLDRVKSLFEYIVNNFVLKTDKYAEYFLKRIFEKGLVILLIDSLDEIPIETKNKVFTHIIELYEIYPDIKIVMSCRTADYQNIFDSFHEVELSKLSEDAIKKIVKAWFPDDKSKATDLIKYISIDKDLQSLVETPLLLSLLCIQFRHDLTLPRRKAELYKRCIEAFLRDWDAGRNFRRDTAYSNLSDDNKLHIFQHVAGEYFIARRSYTFPESELRQEIGICCQRLGLKKDDGKGVLDEIERHHGILERFSASSYIFSHPSFQEYFASQYILANRIEFELIKKHFQNPQWTPVIEFITSTHNNPDQIFNFLIKESDMSNIKNYPAMARRTNILWLLYRCIRTSPILSSDIRTGTYKHIVNAHQAMSKIYAEGGVYPLALLEKDGVRHSYVYFHKRKTLYDALQPFRMLANEILLSPSNAYSEHVLDFTSKISIPDSYMPKLSYYSLILSLIIPISSLRPRMVSKLLNEIIDSTKTNRFKYFHDVAKESKRNIELTFYPS